MNIIAPIPHPPAPIGLLLALALSVSGTTGLAEPAPAAPPPAAAKTQVLFMGADLAVEKDKVFHRVEDVTATALVIKPGGKPVNVPLQQTANLQINESLKIARTSVEVGGLKAERAYTPGTDPFQKFVQSAGMAAGVGAEADVAQGEVVRAEIAVAGAGAQMASATNAEERAGAADAVARTAGFQAAAESRLLHAYEAPVSDINDVGSQANRMGADAAAEKFDAIRLSFQVTSGKDLAQPYYAFVAQIRDRDSKPGHVRKWAFVKTLGAMTAGETRKVNVYQGGLPPGYILETSEVHLYNQGEELATNLSRRRVPLTDDEAMEYRIIDYIGTNKGRTLPAVPATTMISREASLSLTPDQFGKTCFVRVAKDGRVAAVFHDAAGKQPLQDPALESALKSVRFKPALAGGKPVESVAPVKLGQLATR